MTFGMVCSVRGLPSWYQALVAVMPIASLTFLWLTNQVDPGIVPPQLEKGVLGGEA